MEVDNIYDGRVGQIKKQLKGLGTSPYRLYTNQEVVDRLKELQAAMARGVFEKTHKAGGKNNARTFSKI